jgi:hypothetical protein
LSEVGFLSGHVDEEELGDVARAEGLFVFLGYEKVTAKDSLMADIYFWYSARYSAIVLVFLMMVMNSWRRSIFGL